MERILELRQRPKALISARVVTTDPGSIPGSVAADRDRKTHEAAHNWLSVLRVRGGFGRLGCPCPIMLLDSLCELGACTLTSVVNLTVFPPTHWCGWLPG